MLIFRTVVLALQLFVTVLCHLFLLLEGVVSGYELCDYAIEDADMRYINTMLGSDFYQGLYHYTLLSS